MTMFLFQGRRSSHPDPEFRRLLAEVRAREAGVEASDQRRAADPDVQAGPAVGVRRRWIGRRVGRHVKSGRYLFPDVIHAASQLLKSIHFGILLFASCRLPPP